MPYLYPYNSLLFGVVFKKKNFLLNLVCCLNRRSKRKWMGQKKRSNKENKLLSEVLIWMWLNRGDGFGNEQLCNFFYPFTVH